MHQASFCDPIGKKMWILRPRHGSPLKVKLGFSEEILAERATCFQNEGSTQVCSSLFQKARNIFYFPLYFSWYPLQWFPLKKREKMGETNPDSDKEQDRLPSVEGGGGLTLARNRGMCNVSSCTPFRTESDKGVTQIPFQTSPIFLLLNSVYFQFFL